jgi:hypothetical protein
MPPKTPPTTTASATKESARILSECLINDAALSMPAAIKSLLPLVSFSPETAPYIPTPMKITESCAALWGCVGMFATVIAQERYGIAAPKHIDVDLHSASLMLFSLVLVQLGGKGVGDPEVLGRSAFLDKGGILERYRGLATNMYIILDFKRLDVEDAANTKVIDTKRKTTSSSTYTAASTRHRC